MEPNRNSQEPFDSYPVWEQKCKSIPLHITDQLEIVAHLYDYDVHAMTDRQDEVIRRCMQQGLHELLLYIQPTGAFDPYLYQYALSAMSIRHSYQKQGIGKEAWTIQS